MKAQGSPFSQAGRSLHPLAVLAAAAVVLGAATASSAVTMGALGDSYTDEYARYSKRNRHRNYVEQLDVAGKVNFGTIGNQTLGSSKYTYNFGLSGATTDSAVTNNQFSLMQSALAASNIDGSIIYLGINNFAGWQGSPNVPQAYLDIYNNVSGAAASTINNIVGDITSFIDTLRGIDSTAPLLVVNVPDWIATPGFRSQADTGGFDFTDIDPNNAIAVQRVTDAVIDTNNQITSYANSLGLPVIDAFSLLNFGIAGPMSLTTSTASSDQINFTNPGINGQGGAMHYFADALHAGSIFQGLLANSIIAALNMVYDAGLTYLTPQQIVDSYTSTSPTLASNTFNSLFADFEQFVLIPGVLDGDANNDGVVDLNDLIAVERYFGSSGLANGYLPGDANGDGRVDGLDLIAVEMHFGESLFGGGAIPANSSPEPASAALLAAAALGLVWRRRTR